MKKICLNCRYYSPAKQEVGHCSRLPPSGGYINSASYDSIGVGVSPVVHEDNYCGEFKRRLMRIKITMSNIKRLMWNIRWRLYGRRLYEKKFPMNEIDKY